MPLHRANGQGLTDEQGVDVEQYKTCTKCLQNLPITNFGKKSGPKASKSGLRPRCKPCESLDNKDYRLRNPEKVAASKKKWESKNADKKKQYDKNYQRKNAEHYKLYQKKYRSENAKKLSIDNKLWRLENAERKRETDKKWAAANREKTRLNSKRYRARNPERARANVARYGAKNPERSRRATAMRRARQSANQAMAVSLVEMQRLLNRPCAYCGAKSEHIDHVIPISRGGGHKIGNLIGSCAQCNQSKSAMLVSEWKLRKKKLGY